MTYQPDDVDREFDAFLKWLQRMMGAMSLRLSRKEPAEAAKWADRQKEMRRIRMYQKHLPDTIPEWPIHKEDWM